MGRKIPTKKHQGIKDPEKQQEQRIAKIKMKINEPPANVDDQEVPKKLKLLFKGKQKIKPKKAEQNKKFEKQSKVLSQFLPQRPLKPVPKFERQPGEGDKDFLWRVELATRNFLNKSKFEDKYDVDVITDKVSGEVEVKKRDFKYLDDGTKEKPKTKKEKKMAKQRVLKQEKLKAKKEKFKAMKMLKKGKKKQDDFHVLKQDKVEFGEVVQEPPQLTARPRKTSNLTGTMVFAIDNK